MPELIEVGLPGSCADCIFSKPLDGAAPGMRNCLRFPPIPYPMQQTSKHPISGELQIATNIVSISPVVAAHFTCGEFDDGEDEMELM